MNHRPGLGQATKCVAIKSVLNEFPLQFSPPPDSTNLLIIVLQFNLPDDDFYKFLVGSWKRNLGTPPSLVVTITTPVVPLWRPRSPPCLSSTRAEWREFGGTYAHVRTSNTVVLIEEYQRLDTTPGVRYDAAHQHGVRPAWTSAY